MECVRARAIVAAIFESCPAPAECAPAYRRSIRGGVERGSGVASRRNLFLYYVAAVYLAFQVCAVATHNWETIGDMNWKFSVKPQLWLWVKLICDEFTP